MNLVSTVQAILKFQSTVLVTFLLLEFLYFIFVLKRDYPWREAFISLVVVGMRISAIYVFSSWIAYGPRWIESHRLFDLSFKSDWLAFSAMFVVADLIYYFFHRLSHKVRFLWAGHFVHHMSPEFMLTTGLRTDVFPFKMVFLVAFMFWLGCPSEKLKLMINLNLFLQLFLHTEVIESYGPLDLILSSPAQHRLHHSSIGPSVDKNFCGMFSIVDRVFGTYAKEGSSQLGVVGIDNSNSVIKLIFHEWIEIYKDCRKAPGIWQKLVVVFGPP